MDVTSDTQDTKSQDGSTHLSGIWQHWHTWHGTYAGIPWLQIVPQNLSKLHGDFVNTRKLHYLQIKQ